MSAKQIEVQIMGQSYILGCPEGAEERRGRQHDPVIHSHHEPHEVRHDDANESARDDMKQCRAKKSKTAGQEPRGDIEIDPRLHDIEHIFKSSKSKGNRNHVYYGINWFIKIWTSQNQEE